MSHVRFESSSKQVRFLSFFSVNISSFQKNCVRIENFSKPKCVTSSHPMFIQKLTELTNQTKLYEFMLCKTSLIPYSSTIPYSFFNVWNFKSLIHHLVFSTKFGGYTLYIDEYMYSIHCVCDLSGFQWSTTFSSAFNRLYDLLVFNNLCSTGLHINIIENIIFLMK